MPARTRSTRRKAAEAEAVADEQTEGRGKTAATSLAAKCKGDGDGDGDDDKSDNKDAEQEEEENDEEDDDDDKEERAEDDDKDYADGGSDNDNDNEEPTPQRKQQPARRGRKPAAGKQAAGKAKPKAQEAPQAAEDDSDSALYDAVLNSDAAIESTVAEWFGRYEDNPEEAQLELFNFLIKSSGCNATVSSEDVSEKEPLAILEGLQDRFDPSLFVDYPICSRSRGFKRFRANFSELFVTLMGYSKSKGFWSEENSVQLEFINNLTSWVTAMSSSPVRPFRHTATVAALSMATGMAEVLAGLDEEQAITDRQLAAGHTKRSKGDLENDLLQKTADQKAAQERCQAFLKDIFDGYRDTHPVIRADCIRELGVWISRNPRVFCDALYLRYIGWVLSDKVPSVRIEAINAFKTALLSSVDVIGRIQDFCERFRDRIVEIGTSDLDDAARAASLEIACLLSRSGLLEREQQDRLIHFFFRAGENDAALRKAVVPFIRDWVDEEIVKQRLAEARARLSRQVRKEWIELRSWAAWIVSQSTLVGLDLVDMVETIVNALEDSVDVFKDWKSSLEYLLFDTSSDSTASQSQSQSLGKKNRGRDVLDEEAVIYSLSEDEEFVVAHMLLRAVQTATASGSAPDESIRPKRSSKKTDSNNDDAVTNSCSRQMVPNLSRLFAKLSSNPKNTGVVLAVVSEIHLHAFADLRMTMAYETFLGEISRAFQRETEEDNLNRFGTLFHHMVKFADLKSITETFLSELYDECQTKVADAISENQKNFADIEEAQLESIVFGVHRLRILSTSLPSIVDNNLQIAQKLLDADVSSDDRFDMLILAALQLFSVNLMSKRVAITSVTGSTKQADRWGEMMSEFFRSVKIILQQCSKDLGVRSIPYICDIFVCCSPKNALTKDTELLSLVPDQQSQELILSNFSAGIEVYFRRFSSVTEENSAQEIEVRELLIVSLAGLIRCAMMGSLEANESTVVFLISLSTLKNHVCFEMIKVFVNWFRSTTGEAAFQELVSKAHKRLQSNTFITAEKQKQRIRYLQSCLVKIGKGASASKDSWESSATQPLSATEDKDALASSRKEAKATKARTGTKGKSLKKGDMDDDGRHDNDDEDAGDIDAADPIEDEDQTDADHSANEKKGKSHRVRAKAASSKILSKDEIDDDEDEQEKEKENEQEEMASMTPTSHRGQRSVRRPAGSAEVVVEPVQPARKGKGKQAGAGRDNKVDRSQKGSRKVIEEEQEEGEEEEKEEEREQDGDGDGDENPDEREDIDKEQEEYTPKTRKASKKANEPPAVPAFESASSKRKRTHDQEMEADHETPRSNRRKRVSEPLPMMTDIPTEADDDGEEPPSLTELLAVGSGRKRQREEAVAEEEEEEHEDRKDTQPSFESSPDVGRSKRRLR